MDRMSNLVLDAAMVRHLMRKHGLTIRALARKYSVTMKRVREVRSQGVRGIAATEWHFMICGNWLDEPSSLT